MRRSSPDWWSSFGDPTLATLETPGARAEPDAGRGQRALRAGQSDARQHQRAADSRSRSRRDRLALQDFAEPSADQLRHADRCRRCRTIVQLGPTINYDTDLFGRIRREVEGAKASAEQSADDLANARLVLTTDLATDYFSMRELDAEIDVLNQSVQAAAEGARLRERRARSRLGVGARRVAAEVAARFDARAGAVAAESARAVRTRDRRAGRRARAAVRDRTRKCST